MRNFSNLAELFLFQEKNFDKKEALIFEEKGQVRKFSTAEFAQNVKYFAAALKQGGFKEGKSLAIFSYQNPIWLSVDFATVLVGGISVPIFYDISSENLVFQLKNSKAEILFIDNEEKLKLLRNQKLFLKKIITYNFKVKNKKGFDAEFISFDEFLKIGGQAEKKYDFVALAKKIKPQDLAMIIYTSGSTGNTKGVEITHHNLVSQIKSAVKRFPFDKNKDLALSFLPLAHIFENMVVKSYIAQGTSVYFLEDVKTVGATIQKVKPTMMTAVPRLLEKVYAKISENIDNGSSFKRLIGRAAFKVASEYNPDEKKIFSILKIKFFDLLVYKKIRKNLGGNLHTIVCGGAPLAANIEKFLNNIGIKLFVGYGLTETSPVIAANCDAAHKIGTVGKLFDDMEVKIAADNELLVKGVNVMKGYHKDVKRTKEVFTADGWFMTGDLAKIDKDGFLTICGRKKELFKTATGKYVRPVEIEMRLIQKLNFLLGAMIIAEGKKFVSALLFAEFENLAKIKEKLNSKNLADAKFLQSKKLRDYVQKVIDEINESLNHSEQIRIFKIIPERISVENGGITPSMKLRRNFLEQKYQDVIKSFYAG